MIIQNRLRRRLLVTTVTTLSIFLISTISAQINTNQIADQVNINIQSDGLSQGFSGTGVNRYMGDNLVPYGYDVGDVKVHPAQLTTGQTIDLHHFYPYYGGLYNYTTISVNGYIAFANVLDQGPTINIGPDSTDWPRQQDPAMMAPYLCKQQIPQSGPPGMNTGVWYRVIMRTTAFGKSSSSGTGYNPSPLISGMGRASCPGGGDKYVRCDNDGDQFLDNMMRWLTEGVAGASAFRADSALIVTWENTASAVAGRSDFDNGKLATYQLVWLADQAMRLSYVIINYDKLGFDAADVLSNSKQGRCIAAFNGGNHTGLVPIDPTQSYKNSPKILASRSAVPHLARGRYMFRVDDIVRPAGCSNKTGGTFPMLIYPNIVNMLGEMTVDVNAICLDKTITYVLMIEQRQTASCIVINSAIARCSLPKIYDWGTKTVFFQPQTGGANEEKAFVGYIYFVPPTLDPMRLEIGNIYQWYQNPMKTDTMPISWFPRNFTNFEMITRQNFRISDDTIYTVSLGLYVIGYKEAKDEKIKKFRPEHRVLARLATYNNKGTPDFRWKPQEELINIKTVEQWYLTEWERTNELYSYRTGYLKLAPIKTTDQQATTMHVDLMPGLVSSPISLHWMWTINNQYITQRTTTNVNGITVDHEAEWISEKATEMCHDWYDEDGAQFNFIRDTETNASCPCVEAQAKMDIGRFMPHPRCSQTFRDITCTTMIGAKNCYMSAQNIYGSSTTASHSNQQHARFPTHYGQVCCYDQAGFLMQTSYQPVIKVIEETPYNPGYPLRAYEFGTSPYMGQFEVPGLSSFHHDYMPYYLCCKYAKSRCQMFYWRRPSSACQTYQPPAVGEVMGAGTFYTLDSNKFIFNEPGVFSLLYIPKTIATPEVRIQIRLERYPNRRVDFAQLGRSLSQEDLVQPGNVTVVTGIAIEATGTDRVHVVLRKDTRRFRYRTSVIVGNIMRYFDTMRIQRFKGVMVYINNIERGQPEIYVVLEEAQIGIRIRESYSLDIDRFSNFQESMGMLDVQVSVPSQYGVHPDGERQYDQEYIQRMNLPKVTGLLRPFETAMGTLDQPLQQNDVNNEGTRQTFINRFKVPGSGESGSQSNVNVGQFDFPTDNMFTSSKDEDKKFDVFPESHMRASPVFAAAPMYTTQNNAFRAVTGANLLQSINTCRDRQNAGRNYGQQAGRYTDNTYNNYWNVCPDNPDEIMTVCGDNYACMYDFALLNSKVLGQQVQMAYSGFISDRYASIRRYNSCGPINIEYPEYMTKTPALASSYLEGDTARFDCFQTHWVYGQNEYTCQLVADYWEPTRYRYEWNKGSQPFCRSKELDNFLKWLSGILIFLAIIIALIVIFLVCWTVSKKKLHENRALNSNGSKSVPRTFTRANTNSEDEVRTMQYSPKPGLSNPRYTRNNGPQESPPLSSIERRHRNNNPETSSLMGHHTSV
uniref:Protein mesh n=1 Tax=Rhabditophanes sp. KR3021 TaxID=114890 RepID=A0AC35U4L8_9BILA